MPHAYPKGVETWIIARFHSPLNIKEVATEGARNLMAVRAQARAAGHRFERRSPAEKEVSSMPLQNRVTPYGEIIATPEKGMFMGNRGCLHDADRRLVRTRESRKAWVTCSLDWKGRKRVLMTPGNYTELFFLDEATALAAGHRPCAECRSDRFRAFMKAWAVGVLGDSSVRLLVKDVDPVMQCGRLNNGRQRRTSGDAGQLPDGAMLALDGDPWLKWRGHLHRWTPGAYVERRPVAGGDVEVLTPECILRVIGAGYVPEVHASTGIE